MPNPTQRPATLLPPQQLWQAGPSAVPVTSPPPLVPVPNLVPPTLAPSSLPVLPLQGNSAPHYTFAEPQQSLPTQLAQVQQSLGQADQNILTRYQVQILKNPQGQLTGFMIQGRPAQVQDVQQYLLPISGELHQSLNTLKRDAQSHVEQFTQQLQQQWPRLSTGEQSAIQIQYQALQGLYQSLLQRIEQIDSLIK